MLSFAASLARAELNVDVIGMVHPGPAGTDTPQTTRQFVESQYGIMNYLAQHPDSYVFHESTSQNWLREKELSETDPVTAGNVALGTSLRLLFPEVPRFIEDLNEVQKVVIAEMGLGTTVMAMMGHVRAIMATITPEKQKAWSSYGLERLERLNKIRLGFEKARDEIEAREASEYLGNIFGNRERMALDQIADFQKSHPEVKRVALVFGLLHDFLPYQKEYPELKMRLVNLKHYTQTRSKFIWGPHESAYQSVYCDPQTGLFRSLPGL